MIDASHTLARKLTREEVIFKLYGGRMREASQLGMLDELNKPIRTSPTFSVLFLLVMSQHKERMQGHLL